MRHSVFWCDVCRLQNVLLVRDQLRGYRGGEASVRSFRAPSKDQPQGSGGRRPDGLLCGKRRV